MKDNSQVFNVDSLDDVVFGNMVKRRYNEASEHWNKDQTLKSVRAKNNSNYLAKYVQEQLIDERYQEVYLDNRQFSSVRTVLPFLTARVTAPEVTPGDGDDVSIQFAEDFEQVLQRHAEQKNGRALVRLAVQDVLRGERVALLKWRYDAMLDDVIVEHVPPEAVTIGKRSRLHEEPDFLRHTQERSVGELIKQFPDKKQKILELFNIDKGVPSQLEKLHKINEDWIWIDLEDKRTLVVGYSYQNFVFGKTSDPNWNDNGKNLLERPMIPFVFFNFLNDGSGYIDQTSFMEQAQYLQSNYNKRGQTIAENAKYAGTGVPIFAKDAISQKDVAKVRFSPIQRVLLDAPDVSKAFTTWQAGNMQPFVMEDKADLKDGIDNVWAANAVLRGQQSENKTATQDILNRNQAEGRLADPVDCIDDSMTRFYQLEAQLMYRYFDEKKFYNYLGDNGKFVSIVVSQDEIAKNLGITITVKAGTSLPIDRAQKRATVMELLKLNKIGTLAAYKELAIFEDPEQAFKDYLMELSDPASLLGEVDKRTFDREANEDLQLVIAGKTPEERDDLSEEYLNHLNEYLMTDKYKMLKAEQQMRVSEYIDSIIAKASRKMNKMALQPAPDVLNPAPPPQIPGAPQQGGPGPNITSSLPSANPSAIMPQ